MLPVPGSDALQHLPDLREHLSSTSRAPHSRILLAHVGTAAPDPGSVSRHRARRDVIRSGGRSGLGQHRAWGRRGAGTADELLGAHDVAVAWMGRQRLGPPAGWTVALADTNLVHPSLPCSWCGRRPERPLCAPGADVRLRLVSACHRNCPADIRHLADLAIRVGRSAAQAAATATVRPEGAGRSSPPSSNSTTPLQSRLHPCFGWLTSAARGSGHRG